MGLDPQSFDLLTTLEVKRKDEKFIPIQLCKDLLSSVPRILNVDTVRFSIGLRRELQHLLTHHKNKCNERAQDMLRLKAVDAAPDCKALKSSMLGTGILQKLAVLRAEKVEFYYHGPSCTLVDFGQIEAQGELVLQHLAFRNSARGLKRLRDEWEVEQPHGVRTSWLMTTAKPSL